MSGAISRNSDELTVGDIPESIRHRLPHLTPKDAATVLERTRRQFARVATPLQFGEAYLAHALEICRVVEAENVAKRVEVDDRAETILRLREMGLEPPREVHNSDPGRQLSIVLHCKWEELVVAGMAELAADKQLRAAGANSVRGLTRSITTGLDDAEANVRHCAARVDALSKDYLAACERLLSSAVSQRLSEYELKVGSIPDLDYVLSGIESEALQVCAHLRSLVQRFNAEINRDVSERRDAWGALGISELKLDVVQTVDLPERRKVLLGSALADSLGSEVRRLLPPLRGVVPTE